MQLKTSWPPTPELASKILADTCGGLPEHQRPERLTFLAQLPIVLEGAKVQRHILREDLER